MGIIAVITILKFVQEVSCVESTGTIPSIQPFSFPAEVIKGLSATLTCAVTSGSGNFVFRWTKDGQPLKEEPQTRIQTSEDYSLLALKSVDSSRTGNYTCFVTNAVGSSNHTAELNVYEHPEWNVIPQDVEVILGDDARIDCSSFGVPQPTTEWRKLQGESQFSDVLTGGRHRILSNGSLLLTHVLIEDAGKYECFATNGIGNGLRKTVTLYVHVPPQFNEIYQLLKVRSSHSAVVQCDVAGDPPISVKWSKEYMADEKERYKIQETPLPNGLLSELYISRVMRQDAGVYVCVATNSYGKQEKTIKLVVLEPPSSPSGIEIKQIERNLATLYWTTPYSGNSPVTRYTIQYWKDTGAPPKLEEEIANTEKTSFLLRNLKPGTSYIVRIIAENEFGSSTPSVPVKFYTLEDNPSGYPTDLMVFTRGPQDLIVRWKAPAPDQRNGAIQGYEVGYRQHYSLEPYTYREAPLGPGASHEYVVDDLRENTEYEIVVRAYNRAGKGPASVPVVAKTREKGNLVAPILWVESTSASSISLRWSRNENNNIKGLRYTLHYKAEGKSWMEEVISRTNTGVYLLTGLEENTMYHVYIQAVHGNQQSNPSVTISVKTSDPSFERSSMTQVKEVTYQTTLVISLSVVVSCVVIVCVVAAACVYITRVTARSNVKRERHVVSDFAEQPSTSRSTPLSRHTSNFRYVDVNSRPLLWCSTPAPPNDYPSPYATLPLRATSIAKRWQSNERLSPAASERSESLFSNRAEVVEEKNSASKE